MSFNGKFEVSMKESFTQWYANEFSKKIEADQDRRIDMRLSIVKPLHAKWMISVLNSLKDDKVLIRRG